MFTIHQIKEAHSKVKSGADFPNYIREMKALGVTSYEHFVTDGHIQYFGNSHFTISADPKWPAREIHKSGLIGELKNALLVHQQGQTDYPTFCKQAADFGVEKWIVDMVRMTCTYYDGAGDEMLVEAVPE